MRVWLRAEVTNAASRRVAEKAGMDYEGTARAAVLHGGQFQDMAVYSSIRLPRA